MRNFHTKKEKTGNKIMTRKKLFQFSLVTLAIGLFVLAIAYFFFHFVTDEGITFVWHPEPGKPFVTDLIGIFGVLFLFASAISCISAFLFFEKEK